MKKLTIHSLPEDRRASENLSAIDKTTKSIEQNTKAVEGLHSSIKDKSVEIEGFTGVIKTLKKTNTAIENQPEKVVRKIEEVKSASLISNKLLKEIRDKKIPEPKEFPKEMEVTLKGIKIITLKGDDGETPKKGIDYYTPKEVAEIKKEITPKKGVDYTDGDKGDTPKKGRDYFTKGEIEQFKKDVTPKKGIDYRDGVDGYTPKKGIDYRDGKDGDSVDEEKVIKKVTKEVLKKIPDITQDTMNQIGYVTGGIGDPALKFFVKDLSSELNGSLKVFTITQNRIILDIACSSAPWTFRPTVDYTISGDSRETLTFTSEIDASTTFRTGQTLIVTGIRP